MTALPEPLRPWQTPLELFSTELHAALGPWLSRLRTLLGPLRVPKTALHGDPDGVDGLSRRRDYERLLLSEWVLALEAPEEFVRRAAMGEHMFLARAFRQPQGAKTSVAIVDCGSQQLGAPRLAHLVALVVLAQRAHDGGAEFRFGFAQDPECTLHRIERQTIMEWLRARTWAPLPPATAWREALDAVDGLDAWMIGAPQADRFARALQADLLTVEQPLDADRVLRLATHPRGTAGQRIDISLPPDDVCVRILRAPLGSARTYIPTARPLDGDIRTLGQLSLDGRRLFVSRADGGINALHIPSRTSDRRGRTKQILPMDGSRLLGADLHAKRLIALALSDDGQLLLRGAGIRVEERSWDEPRTVSTVVSTQLARPESFVLDDEGLVEFIVIQADAWGFSALIRDHGQQLWRLRVTTSGEPRLMDSAELEPADRACRSLCRLSREFIVWVSDSSGSLCSSQTRGTELPPLSDSELDHVWFSALDHRSSQIPLAFYDGDRIRLLGFPSKTPTELPGSEGTILGVGLRLGHDVDQPQLIALADDQRTLIAARATGPVALFRFTEPLDEMAYYPSSHRMVARATSGAIEIYDVRLEQRVLRLEGND